jgi:putative ABC transport system permease protein
MISLARASLRHDSRRYLAAILAVTFAGLLVLVQLALLLGMFATVSLPVDKTSADLWIGYRDTQSVDLGRAVTRHADAAALAHPQVAAVERYSGLIADVRREDGGATTAYVHLIDTRPGAMAFDGILTTAHRALLDEPDAVIIDAADQRKLGVQVGSTVEINGRRARIAAIIDGIRAIGGATAIASFPTGRRFDRSRSDDEPNYFLVKLLPGADPRKVVADIADRGAVRRYSVWRARDLSARSQMYWLFESGAGIGAGVASLLGLLVGAVITSQTLSAAILASLKEYATLRALGVPNVALRDVVIEQAGWIGLIGLGLTAVLTALVAWAADVGRVAMVFPWWLAAGTAAVVLLIALASGLFALRPLYRADPANLLR